MSEKTIIEQCAPTLAGLKTASLFPCKYESSLVLLKEIRAFNHAFSHRGVIMVPLKIANGCALIYLYRPQKLKKDFQSMDASELLSENGYAAENSNLCIAELARRIQSKEGFPHEVGLFLGYPPEDVRGFMENRAANYKAVGYWKVYGDVDAAKKSFALYRKCTNLYKEEFKKGRSLDQLTVSC